MGQVDVGMESFADQVPMMFRAQTDGRCQIQRLDPRRQKEQVPQDCEVWADEWVEEASEVIPGFGEEVQTRVAKISWRFITNSGQDDGVIRPVIGGRGIPFYPGSSMKGVFRRSCRTLYPNLVSRFCGDRDELSPGILRFHGGYPTSGDWVTNLVDIVHPQQNWQVQTTNTRKKEGGAFIQISLFQPELRFGISSSIGLSDDEWVRVWEIWEGALSEGIGSRVCAGYGQPMVQGGVPLLQVKLKGQGIASKLVDGTAEFRPNMFRAGLRGHALRIFGGLTGAREAEGVVDVLFGGIQRRSEQVGLLRMAFTELEPTRFQKFGYHEMPHFRSSGELRFYGTRSLPETEQLALEDLIAKLLQFGMLLGGFGKAWRRSDHRMFWHDEYEKLIGCHWTWRLAPSRKMMPVRSLDEVAPFLEAVRESARVWMGLRGVKVGDCAPWRETWVSGEAQVWGRLASDDGDAVAIDWLHKPYLAEQGRAMQTIKGTSLTGGVNQVGRVWHRMFPVVVVGSHPKKPEQKISVYSDRFLELLTVFPDESRESELFESFLESSQSLFRRLW